MLGVDADTVPVGLRRPRVRLPAVPVLSAGGAVIGSISVEMRLGRAPWPELCMWMQSRPHSGEQEGVEAAVEVLGGGRGAESSEAQAIMQAADDAAADLAIGATRTIGTGYGPTGMGLAGPGPRDEGALEMTLHRCIGLPPSAGGGVPRAYCQVVLPSLGGGAWGGGVRDFFSSVADEGSAPRFEEEFRARASRPGLGAALEGAAVRVRVFDDAARSAASDELGQSSTDATAAGLVGECSISLRSVARGDPSGNKRYLLTGPGGRSAGEVRLSMQWTGEPTSDARERVRTTGAGAGTEIGADEPGELSATGRGPQGRRLKSTDSGEDADSKVDKRQMGGHGQ